MPDGSVVERKRTSDASASRSKIRTRNDERLRLFEEFGDALHLASVKIREEAEIYGTNLKQENMPRFNIAHMIKSVGDALVSSDNVTVEETDAVMAFVYALKDKRLEELRQELREECLSMSELIELQSLAPYISEGDVELLEAAGVPEFEE